MIAILVHVVDFALRCINRFPLLDSADRSTASNMHHNQISLLLRLVQELRNGAENERITDSVESIFAESMRLGHFLVNRVCSHVFRERLMECAVEKGDALGIGVIFSTCSDDFKGGEVVPILSERTRVVFQCRTYNGAKSSIPLKV